MVVETVAVAFWAMLPAYVPNNAAVLLGGGRPIDDGRTWKGRRILGDGKTWRGTAVGTLVGLALAALLTYLAPAASVAAGPGIEFPRFSPLAAFGLAFGAMLGDILASFVKRRTGRKRGASFPVVDQLDFAVVALLVTALLAPGWFGDVLTLPVLVAVVVITPVLHLSTNAGAYLLGLKQEPY
jgi:CDP-2,3-bis-(O-geranylgeranyl)-sn-glycerol synthase